MPFLPDIRVLALALLAFWAPTCGFSVISPKAATQEAVAGVPMAKTSAPVSIGIITLTWQLPALIVPTQSVELSWDASSDPSVVGYRVYYGVASRTYTNIVDVGSATSVIIPGLVPGATYFFAATSYNLLGLESDYSAEVAYTVPPATGQAPIVSIVCSTNAALSMSKWLAVATVTGTNAWSTNAYRTTPRMFYALHGTTNALAITHNP